MMAEVTTGRGGLFRKKPVGALVHETGADREGG
jgi:hypothetical protein